MKRCGIILCLLGFLSIVLLNGQSQPESEKEIIKKAILDSYHRGHVKSDPELYDGILHEHWQIFYLDKNGDLETADKKTYMSWYAPEKVDKTLKWKTEFFYIDVSEHLAAVKLKIYNQKFGYIDYFNLMKIQGKWWIVHKISHKL